MFRTIHDPKEVKRLEKESANQTVMVFKHSNTCPISAAAHDHLKEFMKQGEDVYKLVVQEQRPLSNEIAEHFKIRHESPQLLFIKKGKVLFVLNHNNITIENIKHQLEAAKNI